MAQETLLTQPKDTAWNLIKNSYNINKKKKEKKEEKKEKKEEEEKREKKEKKKEKKTIGVYKRNISVVSNILPNRPKGKRVP
jgi:hypothetical protein